jgi:hypothetical protein
MTFPWNFEVFRQETQFVKVLNFLVRRQYYFTEMHPYKLNFFQKSYLRITLKRENAEEKREGGKEGGEIKGT